MNAMNDNDGLFAHGKIYLIRTPINGNYGMNKLYSMALSGMYGFNIAVNEEFYIVCVNRTQTLLLIFHRDRGGQTLIKRKLYGRKFQVLLQQPASTVTLTRQQLRRLVLDGSYQGEFASFYLREELEKLGGGEMITGAL